DWTTEDESRLESLVEHAHAMGYWIRFYTINGTSKAMGAASGWSPSYNTGDLDRARTRWNAAARAGVDFIASDQYEQAAATIREASRARR
ncbi:MAG: hypothetical protein KDA28_13770, partial [Phycisphaerales bacterium]|nr:hypothetical protein [Phycisphaerales bacterium]